ncbi:hypothetical protein JCM11491_003200 [Sporobolomyces phaffii]
MYSSLLIDSYDGAATPPRPVTASKRPCISPLQPLPNSCFPVDERRNINRSLKICGFSSSRSTPTFPLSPTSPSSPSSTLKLPELEVLPMTPPATPLALVDVAPLTPTTLSECHFSTMPPSNPNLLPRRQPLRAHDDEFTPAWVRGQGLEKEGYCSMCAADSGDGKWFKLKDGSYWYHRQFVHGVSSVSGAPWTDGTRTLDDQWNTFETYRATAASTASQPLTASRNQWYRHAHACHPQVPLARPTRLPLSRAAEPTTPPRTTIEPPFISLPIVVA